MFNNGHTSSFHKESILSDYVNIGYLPAKYRDQNLGNVPLLNDTQGKFSKLANIVLDKNVSPLLVDDDYLLKNTPSNTYLITTELDILRDDGFIYAERLRRLGLNIYHRHYENMFHGVFNLLHGPLEFNAAHEMLNDVSNFMKKIIK